jgi:hypothetical protein
MANDQEPFQSLTASAEQMTKQTREWTSEGEMRHPAFLGLRTDKRALDVIREQA